jgi:hypothetical protein
MCSTSEAAPELQGFFCGEFSPPGDKKKGLANPTNGFLRIFLKIRHISRKKKLKVARFRQCVPLGRQIEAVFQKRCTNPPGQ